MHNDDEIDLFELFSDLWLGKWAIISFTLIAIMFGGAYAVYKERNQVVSYQSTIAFRAENLPPFYNADYAFSNLSELFHSAPEFETWSARNSNAPINLRDITLTQVVDGVELASNSSLVSLNADGLKVNANDLQMLDAFHSYLSSLNETLTLQYIARTAD